MRAATAVLLASLAASTAAADDTAVDRDAQARVLFEHGRDAYEGDRFEEAATAFERAFELSGRPILLINVANAYDRLRHDARAAAALRQYLVLAPDAPERADIEARIAMLESAAPTVDAAPQPSSGLIAGRTWTWVAAGSALVLAAASAWLWSTASADYELLEATCGVDGSCSDAQVDEVRGDATAHHVTLGLAGTALASAVVLYFVEAPAEVEARPLTIAPTAGGVQIGGVF